MTKTTSWRETKQLLFKLGCDIVYGTGVTTTIIKGKHKLVIHRPHTDGEELGNRLAKRIRNHVQGGKHVA